MEVKSINGNKHSEHFIFHWSTLPETVLNQSLFSATPEITGLKQQTDVGEDWQSFILSENMFT